MAYAELHAHTNFSLLDGTSDPEDMARQAVALGLRALAITDHDSVAGIVRFAAEAKRLHLHAIVGAEVTVAEALTPSPSPPRPTSDFGLIQNPKSKIQNRHHLVLLAQNVTGYQHLCALLTHAYRLGGKDDPHIPFDVLAQHAAGLIAFSGCPQGELPSALARGGHRAALDVATRYRDVFGADNYYVELGRHLLQADGPRNAGLFAVARELRLGCVATNDAHYHDPSRALLHHVVTCIHHGTTLEAAGPLLRGNDEYCLKSPSQIARLFRQEIAWAAEAGCEALDPIQNTVAIAERCTFTLRDLRYEFPRPHLPHGESDFSFLVRLVEAGKAIFYPQPNPEVDARIAHELQLVKQLKLAGYFLVFKEIVDWSHEHGILCSIRGSAPASALLYCLGLCPIDPVEHHLLFERFCSPEREEYPDIDLDFAHERREEVIQHVYAKYGREYAAMVCEVNTYRVKSAIRDVAKVLGLSAHRAQQLADQVDWHDPDPRDRLVKEEARGLGAAPQVGSGAQPQDQNASPSPLRERRVHARSAEGRALGGGEGDPQVSGRIAELLLELANQLKHSPRHHSIHVGGMVISARPLANVAPIEPARMPNRTILPWDKDDLTLLAEEFGIQLIKMDLLGLGMLSVVGRCFDYVKRLTGEPASGGRLHGFRYDPRAFEVLCAADTVGLFQVESRAQQSFLPRLQPRTLSEVAISVGAIRPGPGAARAGEHIVRRRQRREPITYPLPELKPVLEETYGVLLWQEQCIQVAVIAAGYTPGQADQLRRAMSHKRSYERMDQLCEDLVQRMIERGHPPRLAGDVRKMIVGFAGYGFPRAHAYPFAHLALISATLRLRYPAAYYAALLNCQPMGFYAPHTLIWDAHRHGVRILPVDANKSAWECTLEQSAVRSPQSAVRSPRSAPTSDCGLDGVAIRLGFKEVQGLGPAAKEVLERERARGPFVSLADFVARTGFDRETLERLAEVGAFVAFTSADGVTGAGSARHSERSEESGPLTSAVMVNGSKAWAGHPIPRCARGDNASPSPGPAPAPAISSAPPGSRRATLWATGELAGFGERHVPGLAEQVAEAADLEPMSEWQEVQADYRGLGYSLDRHVVAYFRPRLDQWRAVRAADLSTKPRGLIVRAGGLVIVRQRPETASHLLFLTLEDETGLLNAIVYPQTYERLRRILRGEPLVVVEGPLQKQDGVTHIMLRRAWPLVQVPPITRIPSHDFH